MSSGYWAVLPASVRYDRRLTQTAKLLYAEISCLAQADGYCWATDAYFAELFGCSVSTVSRALRTLAEAGYIRVERAANAKGTERHIYCGLDPAQGGMVKNEDTPDDTLEGMRKNDKTPPIKSNNNKSITGTRVRASEDKPDEVAAAIDAYAGDDKELRAALMDFREDRRKRRKPIKTSLAVSRLGKRLDRLSEGQRAVKLLLLDKAIERGWDSVYELKPDELPKTVPRETCESEGVVVWTPGCEL